MRKQRIWKAEFSATGEASKVILSPSLGFTRECFDTFCFSTQATLFWSSASLGKGIIQSQKEPTEKKKKKKTGTDNTTGWCSVQPVFSQLGSSRVTHSHLSQNPLAGLTPKTWPWPSAHPGSWRRRRTWGTGPGQCLGPCLAPSEPSWLPPWQPVRWSTILSINWNVFMCLVNQLECLHAPPPLRPPWQPVQWSTTCQSIEMSSCPTPLPPRTNHGHMHCANSAKAI